MVNIKTKRIIFIISLLMFLIIGCGGKTLDETSECQFYKKGIDIVFEGRENLKSPTHVISLKSNFFTTYDNYKLSSLQREYYQLIKRYSISYNNYKEKSSIDNLDSITANMKRINSFMEKNKEVVTKIAKAR
ncbi:hypothetical protein PV797_07745 [Clostridiaceae bacterium M8S5]|nr:hypothetical protein PV797_07745 [Clostridiaceae bacterium M8S5]